MIKFSTLLGERGKEMRADKTRIILAMIIFGTIGLFRRYIPFPSSVIALVRGFLGAFFLIVVHFIKGEKIENKVLKKNLPILFISGAFIGINWILLFEAYNYTFVSIATVCYYMAPVFVILLSPIVLRESLTVKKVICSTFAFIGIIFVSGVLETGIVGAKGTLLGLGAAVFYAAVVLLNKFITDMSANDITLFQLLFAALTILPYVLITERITTFELNTKIIVLLLVIGIVHTGIAYTLYFGGIGKVPAQTVAIFSYIDPIVAVILSVSVLHEGLSPLSAIGIVLVLGATILSEIKSKEK